MHSVVWTIAQIVIGSFLHIGTVVRIVVRTWVFRMFGTASGPTK